jgi:3',5'-cyclic AMP phosphodiesterase CpdA
MDSLPALAFAISLLGAACGGAVSGEAARADGDNGDGLGAAVDGGGDSGAAPDGASMGDKALRIVVLSDLNGAYGATTYNESVHAAVSTVIGMAPDIVLSTGDMVAGQKGGLDYAAMWAGFHAAVTDDLEAAGIPFAPTPGNHDASGYPTFASERQIYVDQWSARRPAVDFLDDSSFPLRYSYVVGPVLFISLDATTIGPFSPETRAWVESQLVAGADRPVKIVYGHVPLHPFTQGREAEVTADTALEAILVEHGVSLFISGHHHGYYPGRHDQLRVVSTSCLGDSPRPLIGTAAPSPRSLLVVEVAHGAVASVEAYPDSDWTTPIARASLPTSLSHAGVTVVRDDL